MSHQRLAQHLLLPDLQLVKEVVRNGTKFIYCKKISDFEVCPHCASKCFSVYDHVHVTPKDSPIRNSQVILVIKKRRFHCKNCDRIFREPVGGVFKRFRTTERFRAHIRWCASKFMNLKEVRRHCQCSSWLVQKAYYQQIELELRKTKNPWPKTIGIDEHAFLRSSKKRKVDFVTVFIDYNNKRMKEVVLGKSIGDLL